MCVPLHLLAHSAFVSRKPVNAAHIFAMESPAISLHLQTVSTARILPECQADRLLFARLPLLAHFCSSFFRFFGYSYCLPDRPLYGQVSEGKNSSDLHISAVTESSHVYVWSYTSGSSSSSSSSTSSAAADVHLTVKAHPDQAKGFESKRVKGALKKHKAGTTTTVSSLAASEGAVVRARFISGRNPSVCWSTVGLSVIYRGCPQFYAKWIRTFVF